MMSSSGRPSPRTEILMRSPSTRTNVRTRTTAGWGSSLVHVAAGRRLECGGGGRAEGGRGAAWVARPGAEPGRPVVPPAAGALLGAVDPAVRLGRRHATTGAVRRPRVARRVDDGLDVAARAEDELGVAAEQLVGAVGGPPRHDVVRGPGDDVRVDVDLAEVDRGPQHGERPGGGQCVRGDQAAQGGVT